MGRAVSGKRYWTTRMMMVNADPELLLGNFSVHTWKKQALALLGCLKGELLKAMPP